MRAALLLLALLVLSGEAVACRLGGPVPSPGAFRLLTLEGEEVAVVPVEGRTLGATCELSNRHALHGSRFAWVDVPSHEAGAPRNVHVLDLETGEERVVRRVTTNDPDALGLWGDDAFLSAWLAPDAREFVRVRLADGAREDLPFPPLRYVSVAIHGPLVAAVSRENASDRLWVYDAARGDWLEEGRPAGELVNDAYLRLGPMSAQWLALHGRSALFAYDLEARAAHPMPLPLQVTAIDGDVAYETWGGLRRMRLPEGPVEDLPPPDAASGLVVSVQEGILVVGVFSMPEAGPLGRLWWMPRTAAVAGILAVLVLLGALAWRTRRRGKE